MYILPSKKGSGNTKKNGLSALSARQPWLITIIGAQTRKMYFLVPTSTPSRPNSQVSQCTVPSITTIPLILALSLRHAFYSAILSTEADLAMNP